MPNRSKVLIVDDLEINQEMVVAVIEHLDIQLFFASSGEDAVSLSAIHRFAVILMDVNMPGMDGIEATRVIHERENSKGVPIIMITASETNNDQLMKAYEVGAVDYVLKPIIPVILSNKVSQFVELERQSRLNEDARLRQMETNARLQALLHSAGGGILGVDMVGRITFANPKAATILNIHQSKLMQLHIEDFLVTDSEQSLSWELSTLYRFVLGAVSGFCDTERWHRQDGDAFDIEYSSEPMKNAAGDVIGSVVMFQDISERKATEANLKYLATYDPLTDLMNRAYFHDSLKRAIARSRRSMKPLGVMMLDLDHFKFINDSYGHAAGDELLRIVSTRLVENVREGDVVARLGGDEFGIIIYDVENLAYITPVAEKIIAAVSSEIKLQAATVNVGCSIGILFCEDLSLDMDNVIKNADTALYEAKEQGRNNYQVFVPHMRAEMMEKRRIQMMLQRALTEHEFTVVYQPKVSLTEKKIIGCEALLRWHPKDSDPIGPGIFIPIAEESGLVVEIGEWVLNEACRQVKEWHQQGLDNCSVSVNVSTRQLRLDGFSRQVQNAFKLHDITPSMIELEITETGALEDQRRIISELEKIHDMGVKISIDDFGVGNASLDYLRKLPLDALKIDRSFVVDIGKNTQDEEIIRVMLAVAQTMDLDVVAEGVESVEQLRFFAENKCDLIQGYYFSRPVAVEKMTKLLQQAECVFENEFELLRTHLHEAAVAKATSSQESLEKDIRFVAEIIQKGKLGSGVEK